MGCIPISTPPSHRLSFNAPAGFLSPFVITHIASNIASCIVYTRDRDLALRTLFILLAGYLGVAFLQKFQALPIYLDYAPDHDGQ